MQNDALRFCNSYKLLDMMPVAFLHNSVHLLSLEQQRQKQVLKIMFITNVNTRSQTKYVFKTKTKIGRKYEKSSYYLGTIVLSMIVFVITTESLNIFHKILIEISAFKNIKVKTKIIIIFHKFLLICYEQ